LLEFSIVVEIDFVDGLPPFAAQEISGLSYAFDFSPKTDYLHRVPLDKMFWFTIH
jgi:hypothetical protein